MTNNDPFNTYDFGGRLTADFPSQIVVDVTEVCNLACVHCPHPEFKKSPHYDARYLSSELHRKLIKEVASAGRDGVSRYIRYTSNGEPLIHPNIYEFLDDAVKNSGVFVTLTTNGTIMNEKRIEKLLASGLHMIDISVDAFKCETYTKIRVGGKLEVTQGNILRLLELRKKTAAKTKIIVSFIENSQNLDEIEPFQSYWKAQGVDKTVIRRLHSAAGSVATIAVEMLAAQRSSERYPCLYPWERILLNARGELAFCPQDWIHGSVLASYAEQSIREVWQGKAYQALRRCHQANDFTAHAFCGNCPDWAQTRWPGRGPSYADLVDELASGMDGD